MKDTNAPLDRSFVLTEQRNPRSMNLHELSIRECVKLISDEDASIYEAIKKARASITSFIEAAEPGFLKGGRLIYIGAGTSGRLGVLDASEAPPTFQVDPGRVVGIIAGGDKALRKSSEGLEDDPRGAVDELMNLELNANDAVLGIAAGSTTPYVVGGLSEAKHICTQTLTGFLTCSTPLRELATDHVIFIETGPEILTGSTRMKAGTATKLTLNMISTTLMIRAGKVYQNLMVDLKATNDKLRDRAARIISTLTGIDREKSFELLDRADGVVKTAVVMQKLSIDKSEAENMLSENGGRLERIIN